MLFSHRHSWSASDPLFRLSKSKKDVIRAGHLWEHALILGSTGSGKTSGPLAMIQRAVLRGGWGLLWLCAKADEPDHARTLIAEVGRAHDLIEIGPGKNSINVLQIFFRQGGVAGVVFGLTQVLEVLEQKNGSGKGDDFWMRAVEQLLRNIIFTLQFSTNGITISGVYAILISLPLAPEEVTESWHTNTAAGRALGLAKERDGASPEFGLAEKYFTSEWPNLSGKTRSNVQATLTGMIDNMLRNPLRDLFFGKSTIDPEAIVEGKIFLVILTVKQHGEVGKIANVLTKLCIQKSIEARQANTNLTRPIAIIADEFQYFSSSYDALFAQTARSVRASLVFATQNISNLMEQMGGDKQGRSRVDSLLGNLNLWICCRNSDHETNETVAKRVGQIYKKLGSRGVSLSGGGEGGMSLNASQSEQFQFDLSPRMFTSLRCGGPDYGFIVEAYVHQAPRRWSNGKRWIKASFPQLPLSFFRTLQVNPARLTT